MSSLGIVDFIANNQLDEVGATPVWERFRKHFYAVGVGISLFALYFTLGIRVECAPAYSNGTVVNTDFKSTHVNEYCGNNDQLIVFRYSGCMLVGMNAIILLAASYWLYLPNVIKPLRAFSKIRELVNDIHLPWEELKRLMATPMTQDELLKTPDNPSDKLLKQKKIRNLIRLLPSLKDGNDQQEQENDSVSCCNRNCLPYKHKTSLWEGYVDYAALYFKGQGDSWNSINASLYEPRRNEYTADEACCCRPLECRSRSLIARSMSTSYVFRNCLLGIVFIVFISGLITLTKLMIRTGYTFPCSYDLTTDREYYICTVGGTSVTIVCNIVYALAICCQLVAIVHGYRRAKTIVENENDLGESTFNYSSIRLIARFCESSKSSHSGDLSNLINFLFSGDFRNDVAINVNITGVTTDVELRDIYRVFYKGPLRNLTSSQREYDSVLFGSKIHETKYRLMDCIELAELLVKHELWKTFVMLLHCAVDLNTPSQEDVYVFSKLMISFDSLASEDQDVKKLSNEFSEIRPCRGSCHSILYYAISIGYIDNFDVACFLLSCLKPIKPYVHYWDKNEQNSVPAVTYVESLKSFSTTRTCCKRLISEIEKCNISVPNPEYKCQKVLKDTLKVYKKKPQNPSDIGSLVEEILLRRKFREWDETASDFFELAAENFDWRIEFALIKGFFPDNPLQYLCRPHPPEEKKCVPSHGCICEIITDFKYELDDCKYLVAHLAETSSWKLLVGLLSNTITRCDEMSPEQKGFFRTLKINLQVTDETSMLRENIVRAALEPVLDGARVGDRFSVAKFLLLVSEPQIIYVRHVQHVMQKQPIKVRLGTYLTVSNTRTTEEDDKKFKDDLAEFEFRYLFSNYQNNSMNEEFTDILADVPIREWNDQVHKFAELASSNEDWEIVIALLKTHIVDNNIQDPFIYIDLTNVSDIWCLIKDSRYTTPDVCGIIGDYFLPSPLVKLFEEQ